MAQTRSQSVPIGELFLREGLLVPEQLKHALEAQKQQFPNLPLGQICVELGLLSESQVEAVLSKYNQRLPLGELLIHLGLISTSQLQAALTQQQKTRQKRKLGTVLVEKGWIDNKALVNALYQQAQHAKKLHSAHGKKYADLITRQRLTAHQLAAADATAHAHNLPLESVLCQQYGLSKAELGAALSVFYGCPFRLYEPQRKIDSALIQGLNPNYLKSQGWVPLKATSQEVEVLIDDPHAAHKLEDIQRLFPGKAIGVAVAFHEDIHKYVDSAHLDLTPQTTATLVDELEQDQRGQLTEALSEESIKEDDGVIIRLVNQLITECYEQGASDIHIEPRGPYEETIIRFRRDGCCYDMLKVPAAYRRALVSRLKIMAQLDISERRRPQDGKLQVQANGQPLEMRMATIPTAGSGNEDVVLRLLTAREPVPLDALGMTQPNLHGLQQLLIKPYGLILCVGPTGAGKTTTLHAMLAVINTRQRKIWTAEDPVELTQPGLRQVQINQKIGLTFAAALRSFLRADPDVMMIGEIRDHETAEVCLQAALTGHLVMSTLHTNSTVETVTRLLDMGMDPFNFADALLGVLAQRLVRILCPTCKEPYQPSRIEYDTLVDAFGGETAFAHLGISYADPLPLYRAVGCPECHQTGYRGRIGLHELLVVTDELRAGIHERKTAAELFHLAGTQGMKTLMQDGILKVFQGLTDYHQVKAITLR